MFYLEAGLAKGSPFSCKASPFCCISTEQEKKKQVFIYFFQAFPPTPLQTLKTHKVGLLVGDELQFVRFSCSTDNPSSTTVNSPVCTMPFLFSKESFNCSFTLSTKEKKFLI